MYKFIDLFCGIGGFRIALEGKGMECVFSSDIDKDVQETYAKNFGERPYGDLNEISEKKIPKHDILCAGFPCQPFSISGKQLGLKGSNGRLFYEIIRIAQYHKPYVLLLENVKNIINIDNGSVIKTIDIKLDEIGYKVYRHILNSSFFGIPQSRERVYFVCLRKDYDNDLKFKYLPPKETFARVYLDDILEEKVDDSLYIKRDDIVIDGNKEIERNLRPLRIGYVNKGGQGERIYSPLGHAVTLSAFGGGVGARTGLYLINNRIRRLSINECKSLMGFPKNHHVIEGIKGYQQLGNAVIPKMISNIYDSIGIS
ncbi:DNA cytosine methyltransferase [Candidatus Tisiphia endosymbiont of Ditula angustiorana]|uniref:DNA cytosine methyltransferase n=1 Tax=Candidatus Tisiphia endosymbiont of Ditula angustiorana TaxID=3066272 RepID=UPI00312C7446